MAVPFAELEKPIRCGACEELEVMLGCNKCKAPAEHAGGGGQDL
jgi:hypothetical protein